MSGAGSYAAISLSVIGDLGRCGVLHTVLHTVVQAELSKPKSTRPEVCRLEGDGAASAFPDWFASTASSSIESRGYQLSSASYSAASMSASTNLRCSSPHDEPPEDATPADSSEGPEELFFTTCHEFVVCDERPPED